MNNDEDQDEPEVRYGDFMMSNGAWWDEFREYCNLPWYKRIFARRP